MYVVLESLYLLPGDWKVQISMTFKAVNKKWNNVIPLQAFSYDLFGYK